MKLGLLILLSSFLSTTATAVELIESSFDLRDLKTEEDCDKIAPGDKIPDLAAVESVLRSQKFWTGVTNIPEAKKGEKIVIIFPKEDERFEPKEKAKREVIDPMGLNEKQALQMSRDHISPGACSPLHLHDDMANRWCHSAMSQNFSEYLKDKGVSNPVADVMGAVMWAPKEYFMDLNPSASDMMVTFKGYSDKNTTVQVTVFGDALYKKTPGKDFSPFKKSSPFVVLRTKF